MALELELKMSADSEDDLAAAKVVPALAQTLGVGEGTIKKYQYAPVQQSLAVPLTVRRLGARTSAALTSARRQAVAGKTGGDAKQAQRDLVSTEYDVSFEVVESLSETGFSDPSAFLSDTLSSLNAAIADGDLASEIVANGGAVTIDPAEVATGAEVTHAPTMGPTAVPAGPTPTPPTPTPPTPTPPTPGPPSPAPPTPGSGGDTGGGDTGKKGSDDDGDVGSASASGIILGAVFGFLGLCACGAGGFYLYKRREQDFRNQFATDYKLETEQWGESDVPFGNGSRQKRAQTAAFDDYGAEMTTRASAQFGMSDNVGGNQANPLANFLKADASPATAAPSTGTDV